MRNINLTSDQETAADKFLDFLFSEDRELRISGAGGTGKTFLMDYMSRDILQRYRATCKLIEIDPIFDKTEFTATTNRAAAELAKSVNYDVKTIHSFLGLKVSENYRTGKQYLSRPGPFSQIRRSIVFIDESSMVTSELLGYLRSSLDPKTCKIVYVGDSFQLKPPSEDISPVYKSGAFEVELTEQVRNSETPELMSLCTQLRETVGTGIFKDIQTIPGIIDHMEKDEWVSEIQSQFIGPVKDQKIVAHTNFRVHDYNNYIRRIKNLPTHYTSGEILIANDAFMPPMGGGISNEQQCKILKVNSNTMKTDPALFLGVSIEYHLCDLEDSYGHVYRNVKIPSDMQEFQRQKKEVAELCKRDNYWAPYFLMKNTFPDLRPQYASTVYKAQGCTVDTIYVDLDDISIAQDPDTLARLLYVAVSRARKRVVLFGQLPERFGAIIK